MSLNEEHTYGSVFWEQSAMLTTPADPYKNRPVASLGDVLSRNAAANHTGRTAEGKFTRAWLPDLGADDFPPDSQYWKRYATGAMQSLGKLIGREAYRQFAESAWPGASIDNLSWRSICEMSEAAIAAWESGKRDINQLAEAAHKKLNELLMETK